MVYDVIVVGAGLSGLTCAAMLSKKGLKVCVVEAQYKPGGACGIFKRGNTVFEQGASMLYGFGEEGFNSHRFVFNVLEEQIDIIKHDELYAINYNEHRIVFYEDIDKFINELSRVFPTQKSNLKRFYNEMSNLYKNVIVDTPAYVSPDTIKKECGAKQFLKHPISYIKFLSYMNRTAKSLLEEYFDDTEIFNFFDKLTSTYCYATVEEAPAILASIMFVDNHFGGSYYVAGSTLNLVGKLEKVIEENKGDIIYNSQANKIIVENNSANGIVLSDNRVIYGNNIVYSGNVWDLYNKLLIDVISEERVKWTNSLKPTYPSLVLFALVKEEVIPDGTLPIEMIIANGQKIDEGEVTVYILSIDDKTLCEKGHHVVIAIGPSFKQWPMGNENYKTEEYRIQKQQEQHRVVDILEKRFPGFKSAMVHVELSTPTTIEKYCLKYKGAVAGPKQELGQHMLKRLNTRSEIKNLYHCGESTVMGTGTPAVTVSGISAANVILRKLGMVEYEYDSNMKNFVNIVKKPFSNEDINIGSNEKENKNGKLANQCQFCEIPLCEMKCPKRVPVRDINRRVAVGNSIGARKLLKKYNTNPCSDCYVRECENSCVRKSINKAISIEEIIRGLY